MATTLAAFGLSPVDHAGGGTVRPYAVDNGINSGYNITLYENTPVTINASGQVIIAPAVGPAVGAFKGYYTVNQGQANAYNVSNMWTSGTTLASGQTAVALVTLDPQIEYEIQSSGSVTQSGVGMQGPFAFVGSGSTVTRQSQAAIGALSGAASSALRCIGLARTVGPDNAWGDTFTIVRVQIANHPWYAQRLPLV
jgi:hypothetical protein